jgi:hypothetical protein
MSLTIRNVFSSGATNNTVATTNSTAIMGNNNEVFASGLHAIISGESNSVAGYAANAFGGGNIVDGENGTVAGSYNENYGLSALVAGDNNIASGSSSMVLGQYLQSTGTQNSHIIGSGGLGTNIVFASGDFTSGGNATNWTIFQGTYGTYIGTNSCLLFSGATNSGTNTYASTSGYGTFNTTLNQYYVLKADYGTILPTAGSFKFSIFYGTNATNELVINTLNYDDKYVGGFYGPASGTAFLRITPTSTSNTLSIDNLTIQPVNYLSNTNNDSLVMGFGSSNPTAIFNNSSVTFNVPVNVPLRIVTVTSTAAVSLGATSFGSIIFPSGSAIGNINITLPSATNNTTYAGSTIVVKNIGTTNNALITATNSNIETIDNVAAVLSISGSSSATLLSTGTKWLII